MSNITEKNDADKEHMKPQQGRDGAKQGSVLFAASVMVLTAVVWMSLDIYLPALPVLQEEFAVSASYLNLTLTTGIITTAVGTLIGGPFSDKYGRKPMFILGTLLSVIFTFLCMFAEGVEFLIVVRGISGLGNGIILTVTTAMIKDSFSGMMFKNIMTVLQSAAIAGPMAAPALGSFIISHLSWHWLFVFIAVMSVIPSVPIMISKETWPAEARTSESTAAAILDTLNTAKDKPFAVFAGMMGILTIPMWAYLAVCSYIYYNDFGVTNLQYSVFYALGAAVSCVAPFLYMAITRISTNGRACEVCFGLILLSGILLPTLGCRTPVLFLLSTVPFVIAEGMIRALGMVVLLEHYSHVAGAVSAMIHFVLNIIGTVGASLATLGWSSYVTGLAVICVGCTVSSVILWIVIIKQGIMRRRLFGK